MRKLQWGPGSDKSQMLSITMENQFSNPCPQGHKTPRSYQLQWKINFATLNRRVRKLPDAVNYNGKSTFQPSPAGSQNSQILSITMENQLSNPQPQGRKAPRCCKLQWKINFPTLTRRVGKLSDVVNYCLQWNVNAPTLAPRAG